MLVEHNAGGQFSSWTGTPAGASFGVLRTEFDVLVCQWRTGKRSQPLLRLAFSYQGGAGLPWEVWKWWQGGSGNYWFSSIYFVLKRTTTKKNSLPRFCSSFKWS